MTGTPKTKPQTAPSEDGIWGPALKEAGAAFVAAALLLITFYVLTFRWIHPEFVPFMDREATKIIASGKDLIPVSVGAYRVEGSSGIIEDFNGDEAILALQRAFQAEDYPFIKVNLQGFTRYSKFKILWRRADDLSQTHALEFNRSGDEVTQIAMVYGNENYRGRIADLALLFFDGPALGLENNNDEDISIHSIEFRPFSVTRILEQVLVDWVTPPLWQPYSMNVVRGTHGKAVVSPNLVIACIIALSLALIVLNRALWSPKNRVPALSVCLCVFFYGWACNEALRWCWRTEQFTDSYARYHGLSAEDKIRNNPTRCLQLPDDCGTELLPYL